MQTLAIKWNARRVLVEDTGAGTSLIQELRGKVSGIIAVKPEGDKVSRMAVASAKFEAGQVLLPERASWLPDLEAELFVFPGSRHDDQCDSISQALLDKNMSFMTWLSPEDWERIIAKSKIPRPRPPFGRHEGARGSNDIIRAFRANGPTLASICSSSHLGETHEQGPLSTNRSRQCVEELLRHQASRCATERRFR
jgi:hypothetical protein